MEDVLYFLKNFFLPTLRYLGDLDLMIEIPSWASSSVAGQSKKRPSVLLLLWWDNLVLIDSADFRSPNEGTLRIFFRVVSLCLRFCRPSFAVSVETRGNIISENLEKTSSLVCFKLKTWLWNLVTKEELLFLFSSFVSLNYTCAVLNGLVEDFPFLRAFCKLAI